MRPGISIHIETGPRAAIRAIARKFWGQRPSFTLIMARVGGGHAGELLYGGLVREVIAASYGVVAPAGPMRAVQIAYKRGDIRFEHWSLYTLLQRLQAGAQGVPFLPTRSLVGSDMARDNPHAFKLIDNPFSSGKVAVVKALHPDLSIVHGLAADEDGNVLFSPPYEESLWGAKAAKLGVLATVEKVVPREVIKRYSHLVKLPSAQVAAVVEAPFGAHPGAMSNHACPEVDGYVLDAPFLANYHSFSRQGKLDDWVREWVLGVLSHDAYLAKLGQERLQGLKDRAKRLAESSVADAPQPASPSSLGYTRDEMMAVAGARAIARRVKERGYRTLLAGVGQGDLAGALAYYLLKQEGIAVAMAMGTGYYGFEPGRSRGERVGDCVMLTDTMEGYGVIVGGANARCLALLGAGQVDRYGNINSTLSRGELLVGSGGANDAVSLASETLVVARQSPTRLVERVEYVTCPGERVRTLVTDLGVYEKGDAGVFELARLYPGVTLEQARAACGWPLISRRDLATEPPPAEQELRLLRWISGAK